MKDKCKFCNNKMWRLDLCNECKELFKRLSEQKDLKDRFEPKLNRE